MGEPPSEVGAIHDTVACALPAVAAPIAGAAGTVGAVGVTGFDTREVGPIPTKVFAATLNRYVVPLLSPPIVCVVAVEVNSIERSGKYPTNGVTTYPVTIAPPSDAGAIQETVAVWLPPD